MTLVVDASVALKWVLAEEGSEEARAVIGKQRLVAPEFLMLECANALTQQVRRSILSAEAAVLALRAIQNAGVGLIPSQGFVVEAQQLSLSLRASAYDSLYLAVALREGCRVLTADLRFAHVAQAAYPDAIQRL